jgi:hypothetical protein
MQEESLNLQEQARQDNALVDLASTRKRLQQVALPSLFRQSRSTGFAGNGTRGVYPWAQAWNGGAERHGGTSGAPKW